MGRLLAWMALRNLVGYADESKKAGLDGYSGRSEEHTSELQSP